MNNISSITLNAEQAKWIGDMLPPPEKGYFWITDSVYQKKFVENSELRIQISVPINNPDGVIDITVWD